MPIFIITLLGLILRLILVNQSFWLDEGASIEIASRPFIQMISSMISDFHPPFYYLILKYWLPFAGHSELLIRLPNILFGVASIPVLYLLTKEIFEKKNTFIYYLAALLLAVNPFHIYYSQELRMYGLNTLFTLLTWLYFIRLTKNPSKNNLIGFTIFTTLNLYSFYGAFFNLLSQILYSIYKKKEMEKVSLCSALSIFFFLPWMPILLEQFNTGGYLTTALPGWSAISGKLTLKDLFLIPTKFIFGRINFSPKSLYYICGVIALFITGLLSFKSLKNKYILPIWFYFLTPMACAIVISLKTPVLGYWRYASILPALLILISVGVSQFKPVKKYIISGVLIALFLSFNTIFWTNKEFQREDWRNLSAYINRDDSLVVLNFPITFAPLKFYLPEADYFYSEISLGKQRGDLEKVFSERSENKNTIYLLDYLSDLTDPNRNTLEFIKTTDYYLVEERSFPGLGKVFEFERVK